MLGKVMKYEFRASGRLLLPIIGVSLALAASFRLLSAITGLLWSPAKAIADNVALFLGVMLISILLFMCFAASIVRFYQGLMTNEAYLSFSLPVSADAHILGRFFVGTFYMLLGAVVSLANLFILSPSLFSIFTQIPVTVNGQSTYISFTQLPQNVVWSAIAIIVLLFLVFIVLNLTRFYAAFALGTRFGPNRLLGSIVSFVALNFVQGLFVLLVLVITGITIFGRNLRDIEKYVEALNAQNPLMVTQQALGTVWLFVGIIAGISLLFAVVQYLISRNLFGKHLNIE